MEEISKRNEEVLRFFEENKPRIYPCLKPIETEVTFEVENDGQPVRIDLPHIPFLGKTSVFFVLDCEDTFQLIQKRMIPSHLTNEELLDLSLRNLLNDFKFEIFEADYGGYALRSDPNHTSSYILLHNLWVKLAKEDLKENLVISIPARDIILFVKESDSDMIIKMKEISQKVYDNNFKNLTLSLLSFDKETQQMSEYVESI